MNLYFEFISDNQEEFDILSIAFLISVVKYVTFCFHDLTIQISVMKSVNN